MTKDAGSSQQARRFALYPLRIGLALVFIVYGFNKFTNLSGVEQMFEGWGIPAAGLAVVLVATAELFGGLGLLMGVLTRFSAAVLSIVMVTAIAVAKFEMGFVGGWAFDAALLAGTVTLAINGPGRPTLFSVLGLDADDPEQWLWRKLTGGQETSERGVLG